MILSPGRTLRCGLRPPRWAALDDLRETEESIVKAMGALLLLLPALASCKSPPGTVAATPVETDLTPTPTPAPYWNLLPLTSQPEGGWKTYQSDELNFAIQYPAVYDEGDCGTIWFAEKVVQNEAYTLVGLGGTIRVRVFKTWAGDLAERASAIKSVPDLQALTAVEQFSVDGVPAFRLIYRVPAAADIDSVDPNFIVVVRPQLESS